MQGQQIFVVEDNPQDVRLLRAAMEQVGGQTKVQHFSDAEQCLGFLKELSHSTEPPKVFLLLDLRLPRKQGAELLSEIRADETLKHLIVMIWTGSPSEIDVSQCAELGANGYILKPRHWDQFVELAQFLSSPEGVPNSNPPLWLNVPGGTSESPSLHATLMDLEKAVGLLRESTVQPIRWEPRIRACLNLRAALFNIQQRVREVDREDSFLHEMEVETPRLSPLIDRVKFIIRSLGELAKNMVTKIDECSRAGTRIETLIMDNVSELEVGVQKLRQLEGSLAAEQYLETPAQD